MIVIICDSVELGENLKEILSLEGYEEIVLFNSYLNILNIKKEPIDLVIYSDSIDSNGQDFQRFLLLNDVIKEVSVIFLNKDEMSKEFQKTNRYYQLELPFETNDLIELSSALLNKTLKAS